MSDDNNHDNREENEQQTSSQETTKKAPCVNYPWGICTYGAQCNYYHDYDTASMKMLSMQMDTLLSAVMQISNKMNSLQQKVNDLSEQGKTRHYPNKPEQQRRESRDDNRYQRDNRPGRSSSRQRFHHSRTRSSSQQRLKVMLQTDRAGLNDRVQNALTAPTMKLKKPQKK